MEKSALNRIVLSDSFYKGVVHDIDTNTKLKDLEDCIKHISNETQEMFKGVETAIKYRTIDVQ